MLKKFQCQIDLRDNVLCIGDEKAPFLSEKDIPNNRSEISLRDSSGGITLSNNNFNNNNPQQQNNNNPQQQNKPQNLQNQNNSSNQIPPSSQQKSNYNEEMILKLIELSGRSRPEVIEALNMSGGNPDIALQNLTFDF
jgi:hypothetical protein